jgi:hypothetical protein
VLIVALLVAAIIAIALGSYLSLNLASSRHARRTFNGYAALNLAEAGAEEAVSAFNRNTSGDATAWSTWNTNAAAAWQKFSGFDFGGNTSGWVKVYVDNYQAGPSARPKVIAQSSLGAGTETPVTRMVEVTLRRRAYFANGIVAKDSVVFSGSNPGVDSWNSDPDNDAATAPVPYTSGVRRDRGTIGSQEVAVNQAVVWGYVTTGGTAPQVGHNGRIRGFGTPANVPVDPARVSGDFNATFPTETAPADGTPLAAVGATLGTLGTKTKWRLASLVLSGNQTLTILGDVTLILTGGGGVDALSLTGNASLLIPPGSKLTIYVEGDVKLAGNGLGNDNVQPISCQIWGTNTSVSGQDIQIAGNGALKCVIYAPAAAVKVNGNGDVMGAIVAQSITFVGNAFFHYDESLATREANEPFTISKWRELISTGDRAGYENLFTGW